MSKKDDHEVIVDRKYEYDYIGINQVLDIRNDKNKNITNNNPKKEKSTTKSSKKNKNVLE